MNTRMLKSTFAAMALWSATALVASPKIDRSDTALTASLDNGVTLTFAMHQGRFLGLQQASAGGMALKSDATVVRPILIEEWKESPIAWNDLVLSGAEGDGQKLVLKLKAEGDAKDANEGVFVMKAETKKPHLDFYRFPHVLLPSEMSKVEKLKAKPAAARAATPAPATMTWVFEPVTHNVGGFTWNGWKHHYEVSLPAGHKVNAFREIGTWETLGGANGNTLVALRYRGLGGLAPKLEPLDSGDKSEKSPVKNAFSTTEIIPGAAGKGYAVSPVVPGPQNIAGREDAMNNRHGAWIAQPQRGAGANWIDFQYRPTIGLASYYSHMEAIRSLTEVWPGDTQVSFTDCLYFPLTDKFTTPDKTFIALTRKDAPLADTEWRTRYQEMDLFVRDILCKDLNFVQHDPLPTLGFNWDSGWEFRLKNAIGSVAGWKDAGVKRVITHHPGWFNGRGLRQKETKFPIPQNMMTDPKKPGEPAVLKNDTGGDCSMHDYVPQSDNVRALWRTMAKDMNANDIEYWVWITGMVYGTGPVVKQYGEKRFCINSPEVDFSSGYPGSNGAAGHRGITMRDPEIRKWFVGRMTTASDELGVTGFWADSFQNMFMSQMNYQHADWAPQVRDYWDWIATNSRKGVGWMAESHSFPGLSCSIEVGDQVGGYRGDEWTLLYSTKWYRGQPVPFKGTEKADEIFFRTMANKAPIAPGDGDFKQIPSLRRLSGEYMAALPKMNRPYQLPGDQGVLWLSFDGDKTGVLFPFADMDVPAGVKAAGIVTGTAAAKVEAHKTLAVTGEDLIAAFGLKRGDQKDPRIGTKYVAPVRFMKDWSKD